jgi:acyl carrier protein
MGVESVSDPREVRERIVSLIAEISGIDEFDLVDDANFVTDLDIDSLSMVEIATGIEDAFDIQVPDDALRHLSTVGDAVSYVRGKTISLDE